MKRIALSLALAAGLRLNPATSYTHVLCGRLLNELDGTRCRLVEGHSGPCDGRG